MSTYNGCKQKTLEHTGMLPVIDIRYGTKHNERSGVGRVFALLHRHVNER